MRTTVFLLLFVFALGAKIAHAENGYRLWLRYDLIGDGRLLGEYRTALSTLQFPASTPTLAAARNELLTGLRGLLGMTPASGQALVVAVRDTLSRLGDEGFTIRTITANGKNRIVIAAFTDKGILYGVYHFLRLLQTHRPLRDLSITEIPALRYRVLDHWDNLNRHVERGYAGLSLWDWFTLPTYKDERYTDYARANASIGINGAVLNNVNASPQILTPDWLAKAAALADIFRPYGIQVYLSVSFSSPIAIGGLKTADPLDPSVQAWWRSKADEIYRLIPDFGGFLVKANSEGQPGPQNYGRTHADGANLLAEALAPHHGIVIWRAFVYSETNEDRAKQAYNEFHPLDGRFKKNVLIQVKNGPIDFQPREPFHPLFGAMPHTPLMLEVQITQEYLGFSNHLVYLAPLFAECLRADTHAAATGSAANPAPSHDPRSAPNPAPAPGSAHGNLPVAHTITGMAGVANIGNDINWCGHIFAQANWYAFGRLAWKPDASPADIADEWIRQTFSNEPRVVKSIKQMMLASRETAVDYMTPLGLHHIMGYNHHYGPAPWFDKARRADWNPVYYHRADSEGLGFDRTATGSNALTQYAEGARAQWEDSTTCPDAWLLWFHHVSWDHRMHTGRTLWDELCHKYDSGVDSVRWMQRTWTGLKNDIDADRWRQVDMKLQIQAHDALWWRNACLLYFQTFSHRPLPAGDPPPDHTLAEYEKIKVEFAPGTGQ